ncbi:MAG: tetratricopeptide repeat protein [Gemmatimonadaceae bacterium]
MRLGRRRDGEDPAYWAVRLDPSNPQYRLALWTRVWSSLPDRWREKYEEGDLKTVQSPEAEQLSKLMLDVVSRDPFVQPFVWNVCLPGVAELKNRLRAGMIDAHYGCYERAVTELGEALTQHPDTIPARYERARSLFMLGRYDSTAVEIERLLQTLSRREQKQLVFSFQTREIMEYMLGITYAKIQDFYRARLAFEEAIGSNLGFYMAHARLAGAALAQSNDTVTALREYDLAVQLKGDDAVLRADYGVALLIAQHNTEAAEQFRKAIELEPYWAAPYYNLGIALDRLGQRAEAMKQYIAFLQRAPLRLDAQIGLAQGRLLALADSTTAAGQAPPPPP